MASEEGQKDRTATSQEKGASKDWAERVASLGGLFTAAAGVFAALAYVGMNYSAESVYSRVRVDPAEVGLGPTDLLPASAVVIALVVAPFVAMAVYGAAANWYLGTRRKRRQERLRERGEELPPTEVRRPSRWVIPLTILFGIGYSLFITFTIVRPEGSEARHRLVAGEANEATSPWDFYPATVTWLENASSRPNLPACMLFLGKADGTAVFYDAQGKKALRLPTAQILIAADSAKDKC